MLPLDVDLVAVDVVGALADAPDLVHSGDGRVVPQEMDHLLVERVLSVAGASRQTRGINSGASGLRFATPAYPIQPQTAALWPTHAFKCSWKEPQMLENYSRPKLTKVGRHWAELGRNWQNVAELGGVRHVEIAPRTIAGGMQ